MIWDNSDWIAAVSALITFIALVVAFSLGIRSIRETRNIQRREYRNSLLNEITQWATKIIDWRYENRTALTQASELLEVRQNQRFLFLHLGEILDYFSSITNCGVYILDVSRMFQQDLPQDVRKLVDDLNAYTNLLESFQQIVKADFGKDPLEINNTDEVANKADTLAQQAVNSAICVLKKVATIKATEMRQS
jgi:hypothetical protein